MSTRHEQRRRAHDETTCDDSRPASLAAKRRYRSAGGHSKRGAAKSDLRDMRLARGLTIEALAKRAGVSHSTVSNAERGHAYASTMLRLLDALANATVQAPSSLGAAIRCARTTARMTQEEFARELGVSTYTVGNAERGDSTPMKPLRARLWAEFGCDLSAWHADGFDAAERGDPGPRVAVEVL